MPPLCRVKIFKFNMLPRKFPTLIYQAWRVAWRLFTKQFVCLECRSISCFCHFLFNLPVPDTFWRQEIAADLSLPAIPNC